MFSSVAEEHALKAEEYAKTGNRESAIAHYRKAIESEYEPPFWLFAGLGNQLLYNNRLDEAEEVYRRLVREYPDRPEGFVGRAQLAQCRQDWETALTRWNGCFSKFRKQAQFWWHAGLGNALIQSHRLDEAEKVYRKLARKHPGRPEGFVGLANIAQHRQDWKKALSGWEKIGNRFPQVAEAPIRIGNVLIRMGRFDRAEEVLRKAVDQLPDSPEPIEALARLADTASEYELARARWKTVTERFPDNLRFRAGHIRSMLNVLDIGQARKSYFSAAESTQDPEFLSLPAEIHRAEFDWPVVLDTIRALRASVPDNTDIQLKEAIFHIEYALHMAEPEYLHRAVDRLEQLRRMFPGNPAYRIRLANAYIIGKRNDDAFRIIGDLPKEFHSRQEIMQLHAWRHHYSGNEIKAERVWNKLLRRHYIGSVHGKIDTFTRIDANSLRPGTGEIQLYTMIRNERWRLPWFVDYYRKLGVERFFFVDNASDDGGAEFLLRQKDVHVFRTEDGFAKAHSGMRWINELIERYGKKNWCLYVDADEALVFPGVEKKGLRSLVKYMKRKGHEALFAFMIDMFAHDVKSSHGYRPGDDFFDRYPYFDKSYVYYGNKLCPYKIVSGGIRRIFNNAFNLTKTPLIRGGRGIKFLSSSHSTTPAVVSDVTAALLHFKMAGDFHNHFQTETIHKTREPYCQRWYLKLVKTLKHIGENYVFAGPSTERYESSAQLVKLGLMECSNDFLDIKEPKPEPDG